MRMFHRFSSHPFSSLMCNITQEILPTLKASATASSQTSLLSSRCPQNISICPMILQSSHVQNEPFTTGKFYNFLCCIVLVNEWHYSCLILKPRNHSCIFPLSDSFIFRELPSSLEFIYLILIHFYCLLKLIIINTS